MKTNSALPLFVFLLCLPHAPLAFAAPEGEQPVAVDARRLAPYLREKVEAAAQQGPRELIRLMNRTRMIHQLRPEAFVRTPEAVVRAEVKPTPVVAEAEARDK